MHAKRDVVYNRADCPYECGEPLPENLRWQGTPCRRCGRPLFPLHSVEDDDGSVLWPPEEIPRPPEAGQPGVTVWYVVREDQAPEGVSISHAASQRRVDKSEEQSCTIVIAVLALVLIAAVVVGYLLLFAPR
jgi:hypothetical protein